MDFTSRNSQMPTDAAARAAWGARICAACDRPKREMSAFCPTCTAALTIWQRNWLAEDPSTSHWCDNYRSALRHLQLNATRIRVLPLYRGGWPYSSSDDLRAAGYSYIEHSHCRVPGCGRTIIWYWTPNHGRIPVDVPSYQPHRTTCVDSEYFQRRRAARTSAKRSKKRA